MDPRIMLKMRQIQHGVFSACQRLNSKDIRHVEKRARTFGREKKDLQHYMPIEFYNTYLHRRTPYIQPLPSGWAPAHGFEVASISGTH